MRLLRTPAAGASCRPAQATKCCRTQPKPQPQIGSGRWLTDKCGLTVRRQTLHTCPAANPSGKGQAGDRYEDRAIFGAYEKQPCSLQEAMEAKEACSVVEADKRKECYASFGVDADRVESYLDDVMSLEDKLPKAPSLGDVLAKVGGQLLMAFGLMCVMLLELLWNVAVSLYRGAEAMLSLTRILVKFVSRLCKKVASALGPNQDNCDSGGCFVFDPSQQTFKEATVHQTNERKATADQE